MLDAGTLIAILGPHAKKLLEDRVKEYLKKPHGSKVKEGAFEDCTIELDEDTDMAYIAVNPSRGEVIYLTSNTIQSVQFEKEDQKWRKGKLKTYYYYYITFSDGRRSRVRMRRKYRDAMLSHM